MNGSYIFCGLLCLLVGALIAYCAGVTGLVIVVVTVAVVAIGLSRRSTPAQCEHCDDSGWYFVSITVSDQPSGPILVKHTCDCELGRRLKDTWYREGGYNIIERRVGERTETA